MSELHPEMMVTPTVRLKRPLGHGGMGSVWVADHLALKTEVVVKFMAKELAANADALARFSREAAATAQVKSPHVVQTFDYGLTSNGLPYIVMELLDGMDLAGHLERRGKIPPSEFSALYIQMAKALGKAHEAGIVHRDIKPENIFLCDGEAGEAFVKVLDFGIAKADARLGSGTSTGQIMGTPYYMSPEQIVGRKTIDHRADLWSLGVVAFETLTGHRPFDGESVGALTLAIHAPNPPKPSSVDPSLPPAFDAWFAKACAIEPQERFASAKDASRALVEALGGAPPSPTMTTHVEPHEASRIEVSAPAATLLASAHGIDQDARSARSRPILPVMIGALLLVAVAIGAGAFLLRRSAPEQARGITESSSAAAAARPSAAALAEPTPALPPTEALASAPVANAPVASAPVASAHAEAGRPAPTRPVALPVQGKKPTPAAPNGSAPARPTPRQGSDDDIK